MIKKTIPTSLPKEKAPLQHPQTEVPTATVKE